MIKGRFFISAAISLLISSAAVAQLRKGEATVDYIIKDGEYSAVVRRAGWDEKKTVRLCAFDDLAGIPKNSSLYDDKPAKKVYKLLFQPIEQYLQPGDNIYFSPIQHVFYCNLAALKDESGSRLCEKYHFFRVSDVRALPYDPKGGEHYRAEIFGGMNYEASPEQLNGGVWTYHTRDFQQYYNDIRPEGPVDFNLGTADDGTRAGVSTLKESKNEVKFIYSLDEYTISPHTGVDATEEAFRTFIRQSSDYILHISTHSFNIPMGDIPDETDYEWHKRRLMSIGLLFSGAAHTLRGETMPLATLPHLAMEPSDTPAGRKLSYPLNDGLLYGAEIAGMDMSSCELVVLAACNTASGTVTQDGIIGLQSAFKEAGAHTILMTLWSVDDRATAEFMKLFYTYLYSGCTKHESLEKARADLMHSEDFSDPLYWAPFIMLD